MLDFVLTNAKFLKLVKQNLIIPALKSFSDTLLFYYIGHLALTHSKGSLIEIGVGGSTYAMLELSQTNQRPCAMIDMDQQRLQQYTAVEFFADATTQKHAISSLKLYNTAITDLAYCHLDGSKDYRIAVNDLEYCAQHLAQNGIICQDDYGNNKWPTITDAVQHMIQTNQLIMLIAGDSSAWLTRPEFRDHWMQLFANDAEFQGLAPFVNLQSSAGLHREPEYFYMQAPPPGSHLPQATQDMLDYYNDLLSLQHQDYLSMPYREQSMPGIQFRTQNRYVLQQHWDQLRGNSWPQSAPGTRQQINELPQWIKHELTTMHNIVDLYAVVQVIENTCAKNSL